MDIAAVFSSSDGRVAVTGVVAGESPSTDSDFEGVETTMEDGGLDIPLKRLLTRSYGVVILSNTSALLGWILRASIGVDDKGQHRFNYDSMYQ